MWTPTIKVVAAFILSLVLLSPVQSIAQPVDSAPWPQRTVRVIVPLPAGIAIDLLARLFADRLSQRWKQPVVVENRPGADGIPAVTEFMRTRDNHTLIFSFAGLITINPIINEKLPYDPDRDLVPIVSAADNFIGIAVNRGLKVNTLDEFVKLARSQPGKLNWAATSGLPLYAFGALQQAAGIKITQVPYKDFQPALVDLAEGRIQAAATGVAFLLPQIQRGKTNLLVVNSEQRSPQAPNVPTAKEEGYPQLTFRSVCGFFGWRDMPVELKDRIAADVRSIAAEPDVVARVTAIGAVVNTGTPAEFEQAIKEQRTRVADVARAMKSAQ